jgi:hypothetical protein
MNPIAQSQVKSSSTSSFTSSTVNIVQRKCACGGSPGLSGECKECSKKKLTGDSLPLIQPKLKISQPNDKYEQEADRVADMVIRMPEPKIQRQVNPKEDEAEETLQTKPIANTITPLVQRQPAKQEEDEDETIQPKRISANTPTMTPEIHSEIDSIRKSGGEPLPKESRTFMESRFGQDLSKIRIHAGPQAAKLSNGLNARALTIGNDIMFRRGEFQPHSSKGQHLLAHELTHTMQQGAQPDKSRFVRAVRTQAPPGSLLYDSPGEPIPAGERAAFEARLGVDLANVRIHRDPSAARIAARLGAGAFAVGNHIGFAKGEYRPGTASGDRLIAHELVHTFQSTATALVQSAPPTREAESGEPHLSPHFVLKKVLAGRYRKPSELLADVVPLSDQGKRDLVEFFSIDFPEVKVGRRNVGELIWATMYDRNVDHEPIGEEARQRASGSGRWTDEAPKAGGLKSSDKIKRVYRRWDKKHASGRLSRLQCMNAGNQGMSALIEPELIGPAKMANARSKDGASVSRLAHLLRRHGAVGERLVFSFVPKTGGWSPDFEDTLLAETSKDPEPGVYFFLVSLHSHHMVMIMVDRSVVDAPMFYFLDQFGGFLTFNKDGTVKGAKKLSIDSGITKEAKTFEGRFNPTFMWPVMPRLPNV